MVILRSELLQFPSSEQFKIINKDLNIDSNEFRENEILFYEWIENHEHLPRDYEKHLVQNFLRMCKNNLDKAKIKFQNYIEAKSKFGDIFENRCLNEDTFKDSLSHRCLAVIPELTKDCYRILILRIPKENMTGENFYECVKYILLNADFGLSNTAEAGHICIIDCSGFCLSYLRQLSLPFIKRTIHLVTKVYPSRLRQIHLLNVNGIVNGLVTLIKAFLPEKLKQRIQIHNSSEELLECFPPEYIPSDFGGIALNSEINSDNWKRFFIDNRNWIEKHDKMKIQD